MIGACREEQRRAPGALADGLRAWMRDKESPQGEAAGMLLAEGLIRWLDKLERKE